MKDDEIICEFGSSIPVNFGGLNVRLHDSDGNEVDPPKCKCGNDGSQFIMSKNAVTGLCNKCLYGDDQVNEDIDLGCGLKGAKPPFVTQQYEKMEINTNVPTEMEEVEFCVNLYWELHYRDENVTCKLCMNDGYVFPKDSYNGEWCICPEGMKRRKENESS